MPDVVISDLRLPWLRLGYERVQGISRVTPRLQISLTARGLQRDMLLALHRLDGRLQLGMELLGTGNVSEPILTEHDRPVMLEIFLSHQSLAFVDEQLRGDALDLTLDLDGEMYACPYQGGGNLPIFPSDPGWRTIQFGRSSQTQLRFQISRQDWLRNVVEPLGIHEYAFMEIRIPKELMREPFQTAIQRIRDAERAYTLGDDAAVFLHCRGALEALPGAKKDIYATISDPRKRDAVDALAKQLVGYLHSGRHVASDGSQKGDFPVDRRDARFVLGATKLLMAYTSDITAS